MELTTQQIKEVKVYLNTVLEYDDLKLEVLDHFVSDIENQLDNHILFEDVFLKVKLKWNKQFQQTYSIFYFGNWFSALRIVMEKAKSIYKLYYFFYLSLYISPIIILKFFKPNFNIELITYANPIIRVLILIALMIFSYTYLQIRLSKYKSVYSFIIKSQVFHVVFLIIPLLSDNFFQFSKSGFNMPMIFALVGIYQTFVIYSMYKKHLNVS